MHHRRRRSQSAPFSDVCSCVACLLYKRFLLSEYVLFFFGHLTFFWLDSLRSFVLACRPASVFAVRMVSPVSSMLKPMTFEPEGLLARARCYCLGCHLKHKTGYPILVTIQLTCSIFVTSYQTKASTDSSASVSTSTPSSDEGKSTHRTDSFHSTPERSSALITCPASVFLGGQPAAFY